MVKKQEGPSLSGIIEAINTKHGKGTLMTLSDKTRVSMPCEVISTGCMTLDKALGVWGIPRGKMIEIYGPESSGKTTLALAIVAQCQRMGGAVAYIDVENALDIDWAKNIGVDISDNKFVISQPSCAEEALNLIDELIKSNAIDIIVLDSIASMVPKAELEGEIGDQYVGLQARLMGQLFRKIVGALGRSKTALIFVNQTRDKIGGFGYGDPTVTPGGKALKFYASIRLEIRRLATEKEGDVAVANKVQIKVVKNKVAPPFEHAIAYIYFGKDARKTYGIDRYRSIIDLAIGCRAITKEGSFLIHEETRLGNGYVNAAKLLMSNNELTEKILAQCREKYETISPNINMDNIESIEEDDDGQ